MGRKHGTDLDRVLARLGIEPEDLAAAAAEMEAQGSLPGQPSKATLSRPAGEFLNAYGGLTEEQVATRAAAERRNTALLAAQTAALLRDSLTTGTVADRLGVTEPTVRRRKIDGGLYALPSRTGPLRFPAWQFDDTTDPWRPLPGLRDVLAALADDRPETLHPLVVSDFFTQPLDWLRVDDEPVSVRDWLISGGELAQVLLGAESYFVF